MTIVSVGDVILWKGDIYKVHSFGKDIVGLIKQGETVVSYYDKKIMMDFQKPSGVGELYDYFRSIPGKVSPSYSELQKYVDKSVENMSKNKTSGIICTPEDWEILKDNISIAPTKETPCAEQSDEISTTSQNNLPKFIPPGKSYAQYYDEVMKALTSFNQKTSGATTGRKFDQGKLRFDCIPPLAEEEVAGVLTAGATKYNEDPLNPNWDKIENGTQRFYAAFRRHVSKWWIAKKYGKGSRYDVEDDQGNPGTGRHHLAAAISNLMFLLEKELQEDKNV